MVERFHVVTNNGMLIHEEEDCVIQNDNGYWVKAEEMERVEQFYAALEAENRRLRENQETRLVDMLSFDNHKMRKAGSKLAAAALLVTEQYDGVHRLRLAVSEWSKVVADEGGRSQQALNSEDG